MTILQHQPAIIFDPTNASHRAEFARFLLQYRWTDKSGKRPFHFLLEEMYPDIPTMCADKVLRYYVGEEFYQTAEAA